MKKQRAVVTSAFAPLANPPTAIVSVSRSPSLPPSPAYEFGVAQISNLLYRRIPFGRPPDNSGTQAGAKAGGLEIRDTAGWKPALRSVGRRMIDRYSPAGRGGTGVGVSSSHRVLVCSNPWLTFPLSQLPTRRDCGPRAGVREKRSNTRSSSPLSQRAVPSFGLRACPRVQALLRARPRPSSSSSIVQAFSEDEDEGRGRAVWAFARQALTLAST